MDRVNGIAFRSPYFIFPSSYILSTNSGFSFENRTSNDSSLLNLFLFSIFIKERNQLFTFIENNIQTVYTKQSNLDIHSMYINKFNSDLLLLLKVYSFYYCSWIMYSIRKWMRFFNIFNLQIILWIMMYEQNHPLEYIK